MEDRVVRIGCASGFWGDSDEGARQLVHAGNIDYLVFDYLAEITMALLARVRRRDPSRGYIPDFVDNVLAGVLVEARQKGIRIVANAGGVNPDGCRLRIEELLTELGIKAKVAVVTGDDLLPRIDRLRAIGVQEMEAGTPLPEQLLSANAYLGAMPIAAALDRGADIVVTGRCVDSAVVLGPLVHEFRWSPDDHDRLAAGTLLGHLVECGCMGVGGLFTDWQQVEGWDNMGYPIAVCHADGSGVITKPEGTGGLVSRGSVGEQMVYEIGDPAAYHMPDVTCDWRGVTLTEVGPDAVRVSGARGRPPTGTYKVSATYNQGYKATTSLTVAGADAVPKARRIADAILAKSRRINQRRRLGDFTQTSVEVVGGGDLVGDAAHAGPVREATFKIAVEHAERGAVETFCREVMPSLTATAPGICGYFAGRPKPTEVTRLYSFLVPKSEVDIAIIEAGQRHVLPPAAAPAEAAARLDEVVEPVAAPTCGATETVPLRAIAWARSGDKGDNANIGVLARVPAVYDFLRLALTTEVVGEVFAHLCKGEVSRYELPGVGGLNFLLRRALGGGGASSLRLDPQGKCFASILLEHELVVPTTLLSAVAASRNKACIDNGGTR